MMTREECLRAARAFIDAHDMASLADGRYPLDGDSYVNIMTYETRPLAEKTAYEVHKAYADVQYVIQGVEEGYFRSLTDTDTPSSPYNAEKDFALYPFKNDGERVRLAADDAIVYMPTDLHLPGVASGAPMTVKKAVFKIKL